MDVTSGTICGSSPARVDSTWLESSETSPSSRVLLAYQSAYGFCSFGLGVGIDERKNSREVAQEPRAYEPLVLEFGCGMIPDRSSRASVFAPLATFKYSDCSDSVSSMNSYEAATTSSRETQRADPDASWVRVGELEDVASGCTSSSSCALQRINGCAPGENVLVELMSVACDCVWLLISDSSVEGWKSSTIGESSSEISSADGAPSMLGREKGEELACAWILSLSLFPLTLLLLEAGCASLVSLLLMFVLMRGTHHSARTWCWFLGVIDWSVLLGEDPIGVPPGLALVFLMTGVCCSSLPASIRNISGVAKTSGVAVVDADAE